MDKEYKEKEKALYKFLHDLFKIKCLELAQRFIQEEREKENIAKL